MPLYLCGSPSEGGVSTDRYIYGGTISIGSTGIGTWYDGDLASITSADEADWWQNDAFKGLLSDDNFNIDFGFDPLAGGNEQIIRTGYILDDTTGKLCIRFQDPVTVATHRVAVDITKTNVVS